MPDERQWVIRDVPDRTRRIVKKWAGDWDVSIAEALERLVDSGEKLEIAQKQPNEVFVMNARYFDMHDQEQMAALADLVAQALERRQRQQEAAKDE
jgi:hypothetical protein